MKRKQCQDIRLQTTWSLNGSELVHRKWLRTQTTKLWKGTFILSTIPTRFNILLLASPRLVNIARDVLNVISVTWSHQPTRRISTFYFLREFFHFFFHFRLELDKIVAGVLYRDASFWLFWLAILNLDFKEMPRTISLSASGVAHFLNW